MHASQIEHLIQRFRMKGKDQFWKRPLSQKNEMETLITNHVKENVLTTTWW